MNDASEWYEAYTPLSPRLSSAYNHSVKRRHECIISTDDNFGLYYLTTIWQTCKLLKETAREREHMLQVYELREAIYLPDSVSS